MAGIKTTITLQDKFSAVAKGIISQTERITDGFKKMSGVNLDNAVNKAKGISPELNKAKNAQDSLNDSIKSGGGGLDSLTGKVMGLVGAYLSLQGVKKVLDASDEIASTTARIDNMNSSFEEAGKSVMSTEDTMSAVMKAANNARGSFSDMASVIARLGNNAGDAFSGTAEVVKFGELVQKQMVIAGASSSEASAAMVQLSQALASGVLRGDELNSIFEQAPNLIRSIADYMGVSIGQIRGMASEGQITADIVKNAMFSAADDIEAKFANMPVTFSQFFTMIGNMALETFQPMLTELSSILAKEMGGVMEALRGIFKVGSKVAIALIKNWKKIVPVVAGVVSGLVAFKVAVLASTMVSKAMALAEGMRGASMLLASGATLDATIKQYGFNAALLACPLTWIVAGIMGAVTAFGLFINSLSTTARSVDDIKTTLQTAGLECQYISDSLKTLSGDLSLLRGELVYTTENIQNGYVTALTDAEIGMAELYMRMAGMGDKTDEITEKLRTSGIVINDWVNIGTSGMQKFTGAMAVVAGFFVELIGIFKSGIDWTGTLFNALAITIESSLCIAFEVVKSVFADVMSFITRGIDEITGAIAGLPFADKLGFKGTNWSEHWTGVSQSAGANIEKHQNNIKNAWGNVGKGVEFNNFQDGWAERYFNLGAEYHNILFNEGKAPVTEDPVAEAFSGLGDGIGEVSDKLGGIGKDTSAIKNSVSISEEDLKYLRDIAERDTVNRFTTAEIKVDMNNTNNIGSTMDLDGVVDYLTVAVEDAMFAAAEGVYA